MTGKRRTKAVLPRRQLAGNLGVATRPAARRVDVQARLAIEGCAKGIAWLCLAKVVCLADRNEDGRRGSGGSLGAFIGGATQVVKQCSRLLICSETAEDWPEVSFN